jgi:hypothetical protein
MICDIVEGILAALVTHYEYSMGLFVVGVSDSSESFLACCVPLKMSTKLEKGEFWLTI